MDSCLVLLVEEQLNIFNGVGRVWARDNDTKGRLSLVRMPIQSFRGHPSFHSLNEGDRGEDGVTQKKNYKALL